MLVSSPKTTPNRLNRPPIRTPVFPPTPPSRTNCSSKTETPPRPQWDDGFAFSKNIIKPLPKSSSFSSPTSFSSSSVKQSKKCSSSPVTPRFTQTNGAINQLRGRSSSGRRSNGNLLLKILTFVSSFLLFPPFFFFVFNSLILYIRDT